MYVPSNLLPRFSACTEFARGWLALIVITPRLQVMANAVLDRARAPVGVNDVRLCSFIRCVDVHDVAQPSRLHGCLARMYALRSKHLRCAVVVIVAVSGCLTQGMAMHLHEPVFPVVAGLEVGARALLLYSL